MNGVKFGSVTMGVRDMSESVRFYRDVMGFTVFSQSEWFSELEFDGFRLCLHIANEHMAPATGVSLDFRCADLYETYEAFRRKGVEITPPRLEEGMTHESCTLKDRNGNSILLIAGG